MFSDLGKYFIILGTQSLKGMGLSFFLSSWIILKFGFVLPPLFKCYLPCLSVTSLVVARRCDLKLLLLLGVVEKV